MPPAACTGLGKETVASMSDVVTRLDRVEEVIHVLIAKVGDIDQQQQVLGITLDHLEQGKGNPSSNKWAPAALEAANGGATDGNPGEDHSVAHLPRVEPRGCGASSPLPLRAGGRSGQWRFPSDVPQARLS
jgi:hypothetical protein